MGLNHLFDGFTANLGPVLVSLWPLWAVFAAILLGRLGLNWLETRRLARSGIGEIDQMSGTDFERRLAVLFRAQGYAVMQTGRAGDYGADLVLSKGGTRTVVQAKRYSKNVGNSAVQEVVAAKAKYACTAAMVVTNSGFTAAARELARVNGVDLWDRARLITALLATQPDNRPAAPAAILETATVSVAPVLPVAPAAQATPAGSPPCPRCGVPMVQRLTTRGARVGRPFWGCPTFPMCRGMREIADT